MHAGVLVTRRAASESHPTSAGSAHSLHTHWRGRRKIRALTRAAELAVALDHLVDRLDEVLLRHGLPARANGKHARLGAHAVQLRPRGRRAQPRQQLVADVLVDRHGLGVDAQDVHATRQVRQAELRGRGAIRPRRRCARVLLLLLLHSVRSRARTRSPRLCGPAALGGAARGPACPVCWSPSTP